MVIVVQGLDYSIEVEIEMEHRVPTFSIFYLFRKGRFSSVPLWVGGVSYLDREK